MLAPGAREPVLQPPPICLGPVDPVVIAWLAGAWWVRFRNHFL